MDSFNFVVLGCFLLCVNQRFLCADNTPFWYQKGYSKTNIFCKNKNFLGSDPVVLIYP